LECVYPKATVERMATRTRRLDEQNMEAHERTVASIAARVRHFHDKQQPFWNYHGSTSSTRASRRNRDNTVDSSSLNHVLGVDTSKRTALVEPNVPMDALVQATMRSGLVPQVVMEFPGITVGGGFSGTSGESSSFRYGPFEMTVDSIEIVLATGEVSRASRTEKPDLFWTAASAFGTLGVLTLLEVRLIEARAYVRLEYRMSSSVAAASSLMQEETAKPSNDYVDAVVFGPDLVITCLGSLTDSHPEADRPRRFTRRRDPWFYLRVKEVSKKLQRRRQQQQPCVLESPSRLAEWQSPAAAVSSGTSRARARARSGA